MDSSSPGWREKNMIDIKSLTLPELQEEMEKIGTCYMEQEESTTHLEQTVAHMKQTFADAGGSETQK